MRASTHELRVAADAEETHDAVSATLFPDSRTRVLDVSAGAGYTSQLLAIAVGPTGTVWAQRPRAGGAFDKRLK
jgi:predicted methyltransferase